MWRIGWKSTIFAVVLALAMVWTPALAETAAPVPGSGPEIPVGLVKEWTELGPNATRWHAFYFSHPHAMRPGEKMEDTTVAVRLESVPKAAAKFEILTQKEVDLWAKAEKYTAVGQSTMSCGCKPEDEVRKSDWVGMPYGHQMTYVLVKNTTDKPLNYRLLMDDNQYVSFPAPIAALPTEAELAAAPAAAPVAAVAMTTAPTAAATAPNLWFNLQPGTDQWLEFAYVADKGIKHDKEPPAFELTLFVEDTHPLDSVYFDVFTDAEYQQLINKGEDITGEDALKGMAVGCGTDNGAAPGILNWKGAFEESQTIHVRVREGMCHPDGINVMLEAKGTTLTPLIGS
jgi:plasmid maintenance system antidote protein VapI